MSLSILCTGTGFQASYKGELTLLGRCWISIVVRYQGRFLVSDRVMIVLEHLRTTVWNLVEATMHTVKFTFPADEKRNST